MDEAIQVSCIIDKLHPSWKDFKHTLKHRKDELTLVELGSHLRIEKSLKVQNSDKPKGNNVVSPSVVNMVEHNNSSRYTDNRGKRKHHDTKADPNKMSKVTCWKCEKLGHLKKDCKGGKFGNNANGPGTHGSVDSSSNSLKDEALDKFKVFKTEVELQQGSLIKRFKTDRVGEKGIKCIFVGYAEHSKAFRFYVIEPNESVSINSINESRNAIFDESRFSSVLRPSFRIPNKTEDIGGLVVSEEVTEKVVQFDKSDKEVIICLYVDDMMIFGTDQVQVDLTKELLSLKFFMKDMEEANIIFGIRIKHESYEIAISQSHYIKKVLKKFNYFDCSPVSTPIDIREKLMLNNGQAVSQLEYFRVIGCLIYAMTCTRLDIAFEVGKMSSVTEDNSSTSSWVFLLGRGAISKASKKQTCITNSIMESEFVALADAGKEAEWLRNLILEIPLWCKPIAPISILCDSAATLAKAYSQMYNEKSRHLGVRHNMICEFIMNKVVYIKFVRSQQNLADQLTKGLARDLVLKSIEGMGLKSNQVAEC
ncbi:zinc finger, CCHC-type containing protein [Tanacetum coccineum]